MCTNYLHMLKGNSDTFSFLTFTDGSKSDHGTGYNFLLAVLIKIKNAFTLVRLNYSIITNFFELSI